MNPDVELEEYWKSDECKERPQTKGLFKHFKIFSKHSGYFEYTEYTEGSNWIEISYVTATLHKTHDRKLNINTKYSNKYNHSNQRRNFKQRRR
jgi:hypothetical protein